MNNFKELEKLEIEQANFKDDLVKQGVSNSIGTFRFFGDMLDHFLPRVLGIFVSMLGGDANAGEDRRPNYPNRPK